MTLPGPLRRWEDIQCMASPKLDRELDIFLELLQTISIPTEHPSPTAFLPMSALATQLLKLPRIADHVQLSQVENHRRESVAALQKAGNVRSRLAAFEANLKLGAHSRLPTSSYLKAPSCSTAHLHGEEGSGSQRSACRTLKSAMAALCTADTGAVLMSWNHQDQIMT